MNYMTVGALKKALENVPDDAEVRYQRIEDVYFKKHGWDSIVKKIPWGLMENEPDFPPEDYSQYIEVFSAYLVKKENVFILNAHY